MNGQLRRDTFVILMAAILWGAAGCSEMFEYGAGWTFDELPVIEFEITRATVYPNYMTYRDESPYLLGVGMRRITGGGGRYRFYSDEKCRNSISVAELVTINGKSTSGTYLSSGRRIIAFLDFLPQEESEAEFYQDWFFAMAYESPVYRQKVRFLTKSMPIKIDPSVEKMVKTEE
jgi:hypothetical protein